MKHVSLTRRTRVGIVATLALAVGMLVPIWSPPSQASAAYGAMIQPVSGSVSGVRTNRCPSNYDSDHQGIDITSNKDRPIVAAAAGTVQTAGPNGDYGNFVQINHPGGYVTRYAHMKQLPEVHAGDPVAQGQLLGYVGNTGHSFGAHLHFEVWRNGVNIGTSLGYSCYQWVNQGDPIPYDFPGLGTGSSTPASDVDNDGVVDSADLCPGSQGYALYQGCPIPRSANSTDFNGDGTADVFFAHPNGQWWVSDSGSTAWRTLAAAGNIGLSLMQFGDFDGDGVADVFWPNPVTGAWLVSYGGNTAWTTISAGNYVPGHELQLGDFNGDGKSDVLWANANTAQWWISYGGTSAWTISATGVPNTDIRVADLTGDGKDDVFWVHPNGQWWLSAGGNSAWQIINNAGISPALLKFGDIDNDGKDDVLLPNPATGNWQVSYGGTTAWTVLGNANVPGEQLQLADLTADGKADFFWPNVGAGQWWLSNGAATPWQAINSASVDHNLLVVR